MLLLVSFLFLPVKIVTAQLKATLEGHAKVVWSVAFSPDGKTLASGSWDQTVRLWDVETEQLLHILTGHTGEVNSVAFSPEGGTLASGSWDGTIRLWDPGTGTLKGTLTDHRSGIRSVMFSPDGTMLASGSQDLTIRLWNTTTWQVERTLTGHTEGIGPVAFSPDGQTLASAAGDGVRLWSVNTGQVLHHLTGHTNTIARLAFSPDGETLASGAADNVRLWDTITGVQKKTLASNSPWLRPVAFSPDGGTLAIGGWGIFLWDTEAGQYTAPLVEDIGSVLSLAFSPDGQTIASGGEDGLVRLLESTLPEVPFVDIPFDINNIPEPVPPPQAVRDFFDLDSFYQQWINVGGFPVLASEKVNPYAVKEAAWVIYQMIGHRGDILEVLALRRKRFTVLAVTESFSDTPEYDLYFNYPTKFMGAYARDINCSCPVTLASEENLIYLGINFHLTIHEFAHTIHEGLNRLGPEFDNRLRATYEAAMEKGLYHGYYASSNRDEYWAEGVESWFHATQSNVVNTRSDLKTYDPGLAKLIAEIFGDGDWRYTPPDTRLHLPHLQELNPQDFPRFDGSPPWEIGAVELEEQLKNPNSDGGGKWVDLKLYHPSQLPSLIESTTRGGDTAFIWVNLTGGEISFYTVDADGAERWVYTAATKPFSDANTHVGAIWLIKDHNGEDLAVFRAEEKTGRVLISAAPVLITPGLSKISGDSQIGVSGAILGNPFVIKVRDENLSTLEGISVTFTVTTGDGTLNVKHTTTDENGRAESTLRLGPNLGTNTVSVSAAGIEGTVVFNAVAEAEVNLPDPNLRAAIETALGKASGAPIVLSDMARLTWLIARNANITDLTGLEHATHLIELYLDGGEVAPGTWGNSNSVSDLSPLAGLTHLEILDLWVNSVSDISVLAGLTNLKGLGLLGNNITDLSPLVANADLGEGDTVDVRGNPLSYQSIHTHIPALQSRGVTVEFDNRTHPALLKISGDNQKGTSFTPLPQPFVIEAQDANGSALAGISVTFAVTAGGGTLSATIIRTDENGRAQSTLTLGPNLGTNTVEVSAARIEVPATFHAISDTESPPITADVNGDGSVNILDLIVIASKLGNQGQNLAADVNRDGVVSVLDLILVAGLFDGAAAAPSTQPQVPGTLTAVEVQGWLTDARALEVRDPIMKRGFGVLEKLLVFLTPRETELLANYPNPFNPETWIPYRLAEDAFVTLTIYDQTGQVVRGFEVGHRIASAYESRSKAIYWDGRNETGEQVASGVYFYHLSADDYSETRKMLILK